MTSISVATQHCSVTADADLRLERRMSQENLFRIPLIYFWRCSMLRGLLIGHARRSCMYKVGGTVTI